jgi:hypothetical protein
VHSRPAPPAPMRHGPYWRRSWPRSASATRPHTLSGVGQDSGPEHGPASAGQELADQARDFLDPGALELGQGALRDDRSRECEVAARVQWLVVEWAWGSGENGETAVEEDMLVLFATNMQRIRLPSINFVYVVFCDSCEVKPARRFVPYWFGLFSPRCRPGECVSCGPIRGFQGSILFTLSRHRNRNRHVEACTEGASSRLQLMMHPVICSGLGIVIRLEWDDCPNR